MQDHSHIGIERVPGSVEAKDESTCRMIARDDIVLDGSRQSGGGFGVHSILSREGKGKSVIEGGPLCKF